MTNAPSVYEVWKHCPRCGSDDTDHGENPFRCHSCDYRHHFTPISAVGGLLVDPQDRMLFIVRGKDPGRGKLGLPGGFVDPGERAEEALQREICEETGFEIEQPEFLASFPNRYEYAGVVADVTDLFFTVRCSTLSGGTPQDGEVDEIQLRNPSSLRKDDLAFPTHWQALQAYRSR